MNAGRCLLSILSVVMAVALTSSSDDVVVDAAVVAKGPWVAPPSGGRERFVKENTDAAKKALRKKDYDAAEAAWMAVLELDRVSVAALSGLADVYEARDDVDGELWARMLLEDALADLVALEDRTAAKLLAASEARVAKIDPFKGEGQGVLDEYAAAQEELGQLYLDNELYSNALAAWQRRSTLVRPGSEADNRVTTAIDRILREGGDDVAISSLDARFSSGGKDEEWIAAFDKKHGSWSKGAKWETPHYRIKTDAGYRLGSGASLACEQVHKFFREVWGIVPDPPIKNVDPSLRNVTIPPLAIDVYSTREAYLKRSSAPEWSGGVFTGSSILTYDHGGGTGSYRETYRTLFHEISHQFMNAAVGSTPSFMNEGMACLHEGIELLSNGTIRRDLPVSGYLNALVTDLESGSALSLREITGGKSAFANEPEYYKYRWGVMYFLRMFVDEQGEYAFRDRQREYMYEFKKGAPGDMVEHFTKFFMEDHEVPGFTNFDEFEAKWKQWILDLDASLKSENKRLDEYRGKARLALLKKDYGTAKRFYQRCLDIDPEDLDSLHGMAQAAEALDETDRALIHYRRFLDRTESEDKRYAKAMASVVKLDENDELYVDADRSFIGGMASLAQRYDKEGLTRMALYWGREALIRDPYARSARLLVDRLTRETGMSIDIWQRLFNGFDLDGWYAQGGGEGFYVRDGELRANSDRMEGLESGSSGDVSVYRTLFVDRQVDGDWSLEADITMNEDWQIVGLCFGGKGPDDFEVLVLRRSGDEINNVGIYTFKGDFIVRGDGSHKVTYDAREGVNVRIDVRGTRVSYFINGERLRPIVDKRHRESLEYPIPALAGDIGILASTGVSKFSNIRLLAR